MPRLNRLLIISHTPHYENGDHLVGWGPTVREIDVLSRLFSTVVHVAPVYNETPPASALPYEAANIEVHRVRPSGGKTILAKSGILRQIPEYWKTIRRELKKADIVHVRCPANISLLALLILALTQEPRPRWIKYAGNWQPQRRDPMSYTFQRWWLRKRFHKGVVTVNGRWPNQPDHIYSFYNPSLTTTDLLEGRKYAGAKRLQSPINLLFVGRAEEEKGVGRAIKICRQLQQQGIDCCLNIVGDGPQAAQYQLEVDHLKMTPSIRFHGWKARDEIADFYAGAHFLLLPTAASEGWPKVLSEGMAYGVVPVVGAVSSIPQFLTEFGTGAAIPPYNARQFVQSVKNYTQNPALWAQHSRAGVDAATLFTFKNYLEDVCELFDDAWQITLTTETAVSDFSFQS